MIAKKVKANSALATFRALVAYVTTESNEYRLNHEEIRFTNLESSTDDLEMALAEVKVVQDMKPNLKGPTYHLIVSFQKGEEPDAAVLRDIEDEIASELGFDGHQRISVVHRDTDYVHMHIAINRVHAQTLKAHKPEFDFQTLGRTCEALERKHNLQIDNHQGQNVGTRGLDLEHKTGIESLTGFLQRECADFIRKATNWEQIHDFLGEKGISLKLRGNGMVFEAGDIHVKASNIGRDLSKPNLEKRLGAFTTMIREVEGVYRSGPAPVPNEQTPRARLWDEYVDYMEKANGANPGDAYKGFSAEVDAALAKYKTASAVARLAGGGYWTGVFLRSAMSSEIKGAKRKLQKKIDGAKRLPKMSFNDYLQKRADAGDRDALEALRAKQTYGGNRFVPENLAEMGAKHITKSGTRLAKAGEVVLGEDGGGITFRGVKYEVTDETLAVALKEVAAKYPAGELSGSDYFKSRCVKAAVKFDVPIRFTGELEAERLKGLAAKVQPPDQGRDESRGRERSP